MAQIITEEAVILYDPIETVFDVQPIGGMLGQRQNTITGEYSPDRSVTPMVLSPSLQVIDPNITEGSQSSDETERMTIAWYIVTTENGRPAMASFTSSYFLSTDFSPVRTVLMSDATSRTSA